MFVLYAMQLQTFDWRLYNNRSVLRQDRKEVLKYLA
jgi:hypothetical protein